MVAIAEKWQDSKSDERSDRGTPMTQCPSAFPTPSSRRGGGVGYSGGFELLAGVPPLRRGADAGAYRGEALSAERIRGHRITDDPPAKEMAVNPSMFSLIRVVRLPHLLGVLALQGCVGTLQSVNLVPNQTPASGVPLSFALGGTGKCDEVFVDWGDGRSETRSDPVRFSGNSPGDVASRTLTHTFSGWGGGKTVTAIGRSGCEGRVNTRFKIPPLQRQIGWAQPGPSGPSTCQTSPGMPTMVPRMLVDISATTIATRRDINFGCPLESCVYNADGKPGSVADSRFPFPGMREYSVVYRIGSQPVQGGTSTRFTTTVSGALLFCLNDGDNNLGNNTGGFDVTIGVDQLGPP